jgi:hypothetical protein
MSKKKRKKEPIQRHRIKEWALRPLKQERLGNFKPFEFPIIRRVFPKLIREDLVSIQPMK